MPLDPLAQQMLDDFLASGRPNAHLLPVEQARANFEALFAGLPRPEVAEVADHEIPVADGSTITISRAASAGGRCVDVRKPTGRVATRRTAR